MKFFTYEGSCQLVYVGIGRFVPAWFDGDKPLFLAISSIEALSATIILQCPRETPRSHPGALPKIR
jgi:hypothetical protein